jgi:hypothetical protein
LLGGFGSLGGSIRVPGLSSGLETIAGGVKDILSTAKDTVEKLTPAISVEFNAQVGHEDVASGHNGDNPNNANFPQINGGGNVDSGYNQNPNLNANFQHTTNSYPHYEVPSQSATDGFNEAQTNSANSQKEADGEVITYVDNNFPVILLKENEIRR